MKQSRGFWIFTACMILLTFLGGVVSHQKREAEQQPVWKQQQRPISMLPSMAPSPTPEATPDLSGEEPDAPDIPTVTAGAFCRHEGAPGITKSGKPMICIKMPGERQARWREP